MERELVERLTDLTDADADALRRLVWQLDPEAVFDAEAVRRAIRQGTSAVYVIRRQADLVASATAVRFVTPTGGHCRIEDVVVDERCRGEGLGRKIVIALLDAMRAEGVRKIELTSRPSRIAANALYRNLGFTLRQTNVYAHDLEHEQTPPCETRPDLR